MVAPILIVHVLRNGSICEALMRRSADSECSNVVWMSKEVVEGEQSSLAHKKP